MSKSNPSSSAGKYLSTQPYKGARDFYPEEMVLRSYIFDTWRAICRKFGYEEYDFPILEPLEIFAAKTGEEIVNEQLFSFEDKAGRKLAIRPEITPGTVRMIAARYQELAKPIRWFMIGNNWRFEKPQRGRGREFYQLEVNIFGEKGAIADLEIFALIVEIMTTFGATEEMFEILVSDRRLVSALLEDDFGLSSENAAQVRTLMDKKKKMSSDEFVEKLKRAGLTPDQINRVIGFMESDFESLSEVLSKESINTNQGYTSLKQLFNYLEDNNLKKYCRFDPAIIRGFDYSDGLVYEVFDKNPENNRSLFGGERFDKLINIFGDYDLAATGFAMGDVTLRNFLESWKLLPQFKPSADVFITLWNESEAYINETFKIAQDLRKNNLLVEMELDGSKSFGKQLAIADKKGIKWVVMIGEEEMKNNTFSLKNMQTGEQTKCESLDKVVEMIQSEGRM